MSTLVGKLESVRKELPSTLLLHTSNRYYRLEVPLLQLPEFDDNDPYQCPIDMPAKACKKYILPEPYGNIDPSTSDGNENWLLWEEDFESAHSFALNQIMHRRIFGYAYEILNRAITTLDEQKDPDFPKEIARKIIFGFIENLRLYTKHYTNHPHDYEPILFKPTMEPFILVDPSKDIFGGPETVLDRTNVWIISRVKRLQREDNKKAFLLAKWIHENCVNSNSWFMGNKLQGAIEILYPALHS